MNVFDAALERKSEDQDAPRLPAPAPDDRGDTFERKIFFATDRRRYPNPRSFARAFGVPQSKSADGKIYCGAIRWNQGNQRQIGVPVDEETLEFDGEILRDTACDRLLEAVVTSGARRAMLFVHGYNTKFPAAAARAAALKVDLGWQSPVILWSWPSRGQAGAYKKDGDAISSSRWRLRPFLRKMDDAGFERIDLVTHSMGGRIGIEVLALAGSEQPNPFARAIFVAPDVSTSDFSDALSGSNYSGGTTLYANRYDVALNFSQIWNDGKSRAGQAGEFILRMDGLETIDASEIDYEDGNNHSHAFDVPEGLADLTARLSNDEPTPGQRNLRREPPQGSPFHWIIERDPQLRARQQ